MDGKRIVAAGISALTVALSLAAMPAQAQTDRWRDQHRNDSNRWQNRTRHDNGNHYGWYKNRSSWWTKEQARERHEDWRDARNRHNRDRDHDHDRDDWRHHP